MFWDCDVLIGSDSGDEFFRIVISRNNLFYQRIRAKEMLPVVNRCSLIRSECLVEIAVKS